MADQGLLPEFPLFAEMTREETCGEGMTIHVPYYICLWNTNSNGMFCAHQMEDFAEVLEHLRDSHDLLLKPRLDFCAPCGLVYHSRLEGIEHMISSHILLYEDFDVTCEPRPLDADTTLFLEGIFAQVKEIRKQLMSQLLFAENFPAPEAFNFDEPSTD